jgi:FtsP/CotA-like multicopper oxidase with cupredoxin domain
MVKILAAIGSTAILALVGAASTAAAAPAGTPYVQNVGITILAGDRIAGPNIALAPGVPVRITVTNLTRQFHTFTAPGLGLSVLILPARGQTAKTTTFSFTPHQWGSFAWHCVICPTGMHGTPHTMDGTIYLVINPSALP